MSTDHSANSNGGPNGLRPYGVNLDKAPPRAATASFGEVAKRDLLGEFACEFYQEAVKPELTGRIQGNPQISLSEPAEVVDRLAADYQSALRAALPLKEVAGNSGKVLEHLRNRTGPFEEIASATDEAFSPLAESIRHFNEDLPRHSIAAGQALADGLRATAAKWAFERPATLIAQDTDRLEKICQFILDAEQEPGLLPPLTRDMILRELRSLGFERVVSIAKGELDTLLRKPVAEARRLCLNTADKIEDNVRRRMARIDAVGVLLTERVRKAQQLSGRRSAEQTIFLPSETPGENWDRLATRLQVSSRSACGKAFVKKFEAALNQELQQSAELTDPKPMEELFRRLSGERIAQVYLDTLRESLGDEQSIFEAISGDIDHYVDLLFGKASPTMLFAGRIDEPFGVGATLTAYLLIPYGSTEAQIEIRKQFEAELSSRFKRITIGHQTNSNSIQLQVYLTPFVVGTQFGLRSAAEAYVLCGSQHYPGLYGPNFEVVPPQSLVADYIRDNG